MTWQTLASCCCLRNVLNLIWGGTNPNPTPKTREKTPHICHVARWGGVRRCFGEWHEQRKWFGVFVRSLIEQFKESEISKITRGIQFFTFIPMHHVADVFLGGGPPIPPPPPHKKKHMFVWSFIGAYFFGGFTHLDLTASGRAWSPRVGISHDVVLMERNPKAKPPGMVLKPCK